MGRTIRQLILVAGPPLAALIWLRYELAHPAAAVRAAVTAQGPVVVIGPGRFYLAYAAFLVASALVPALLILDSMLVRQKRRLGRRASVPLLVLAVALPCAVAGYTWEAMRSQVTLTEQRVTFRRGGDTESLLWGDVSAMRLRIRGGGQTLEYRGPGRVIAIDLSPFGRNDRLLLVRRSVSMADMGLVRYDGSREWVWRRQLPRIAPTDAPLQHAPKFDGPLEAPHGTIIMPGAPR